jgi:mannose-6-phosphate isomerase
MQPLQLLPEYRPYVWGGHRLRPGPERTAEAWVIYEQDRIAAGPYAGRSLAEAAAAEGKALLGRAVAAHTGPRFPLLIKLLDSAQWLSLQVHPTDELAVQLEGPGFFGKTEAWHVLEAEPGAQLISGFRPGVSRAEMEQGVRQGTIMDLVERHTVQAGDSLFIRAGLIHALGPGLLMYEVQQTSDLTYRVYDWGRDPSAGRPLHIDKSLAALNPDLDGRPKPLALRPAEIARLVACEYFTLDLLTGQDQPIACDTHGESFHALTVLEGEARLEMPDGWTVSLGRFDSVVVPAACGAYRLAPLQPFRALCAAAV